VEISAGRILKTVKTYTQLFAVREYRTLFASNCLSVAANTLSGLALGSLTFIATKSTLLTALAMFGAPLASVVGSLTLLSAADSLPPRRMMVTLTAAATAAALCQAVPGLPLWSRFAILVLMGLVTSVTAGAKWGLVADVLPDGAYLLGRATLNISVGVMQIVGFGFGGLLLGYLRPTGLFLLAAAASLTALVWLRTGLIERPPRSRVPTSPVRTLRVNRQLLASPVRRPIYLALWVPNGLIVGCEALLIPYAGDRAGYLLAATAIGMLAGDVIVGRFVPPPSRDRLIWPLRTLLAAPYLMFLVHPPLWLAAPLIVTASFGYSASLPLQDRLLRNTDDQFRGQVLGLFSNGLMAMQAIGAGLAGLLAGWISLTATIPTMAALSLAVNACLTTGLHRSDRPARTRPKRRVPCGQFADLQVGEHQGEVMGV
jgi:predicted MFS family arabinose efflux permease